jgi:enoyl-CoA hydratase
MAINSASLDQQDSISIITLDDGKANVFSPTMIDAVNECLDKVPTESGSLVIKGRDGIFSGGFDLKVLQSGNNKLIQEMTLGGFKLLSRIFSFPRPVIAACSGHGIALGAFLLCCCDYRIGVKGEFMVGANEMRTNMVIPTPILELIRFRVAQTHKYRAVLGAEMYNLDTAIEVGLIDETIEQEKLNDRVMEKAKELSTMGHPSYTMTKELFIKDTHEAIENYLSEIGSDAEALKRF